MELVQRAFAHQRVPSDHDIERYLAELLERFSTDEKRILSAPLRKMFLEVMSENKDTQFIEMKEIGDASLFTAGILVPNISRSILGTHYYIEVGEKAYRFLFFNLKSKNDALRVHEQFAHDLKPFVRVLKEIGREYVFKASIGDIVRVFERYMLRGGEEDRQWLLEHGVTVLPEFTDPKKRIIV